MLLCTQLLCDPMVAVCFLREWVLWLMETCTKHFIFALQSLPFWVEKPGLMPQPIGCLDFNQHKIQMEPRFVCKVSQVSSHLRFCVMNVVCQLCSLLCKDSMIYHLFSLISVCIRICRQVTDNVFKINIKGCIFFANHCFKGWKMFMDFHLHLILMLFDNFHLLELLLLMEILSAPSYCFLHFRLFRKSLNGVPPPRLGQWKMRSTNQPAVMWK